MNNFQDTIVSQFANSPVIVQLVTNMNVYVDPTADLDAFYNVVWDVLSAEGFGLDIWGRIVGVVRNLNLPVGMQNLGLYVFTPGTYVLGDADFRTLILAKCLSNITNCTPGSINQLLTNLFPGRGRCYVTDLAGMAMNYVFEFFLQPFELAIVSQSGAIPRPAGVKSGIVQVATASTFGFEEQGNLQPFNQGTFYPGTSNVTI